MARNTPQGTQDDAPPSKREAAATRKKEEAAEEAARLSSMAAEWRKSGVGPLLGQLPGSSIMWIRTCETPERWVYRGCGIKAAASDGVEIMRELEENWPRYVKNALPRWINEQYAAPLHAIEYDLRVEADSFRHHRSEGGAILTIAAGRRRNIEAKYDADVEKWLEYFFAEDGRGLDWIACVTDHSQPCAALYLYGAPSIGKGMFVEALSQLWIHGFTPFEVAIQRFNNQLIQAPLVVLDEGLPSGHTNSAALRRLIGNTKHRTEEKQQSTGAFSGAVRVVITANNLDAMRIRDIVTEDDADAVGKRVLLIEGDPRASEFLESMNTRESGWITLPGDRPGRVARHFRWLIESAKNGERRVTRGKRFAVEGDVSRWKAASAQQGGRPCEVLIAIARYVQDPHLPTVGGPPIVLETTSGETIVAVNANHLSRDWYILNPEGGRGRQPSLGEISRALGACSTGGKKRRFGDESLQGRHIPARAVYEAARAGGIGDLAKLAKTLGIDLASEAVQTQE